MKKRTDIYYGAHPSCRFHEIGAARISDSRGRLRATIAPAVVSSGRRAKSRRIHLSRRTRAIDRRACPPRGKKEGVERPVRESPPRRLKERRKFAAQHRMRARGRRDASSSDSLRDRVCRARTASRRRRQRFRRKRVSIDQRDGLRVTVYGSNSPVGLLLAASRALSLSRPESLASI